MEKFSILKHIKDLYSQGDNIIQFLNEMDKSSKNSIESICISYDLQSGKYVEAFKKDPSSYFRCYEQYINILKNLGSFHSIMEAGVGEATTFRAITEQLDIPSNNCYGFDISWSRLKVAREFLQSYSLSGHQLFVGNLFSIPLCDNAIDVVYTSHSIEPNGGYERPILEELYRVTDRYLVLFEPDYGLAGDEAKARMDKHGYVKDLFGTAKSLGYHVIKHELLGYSGNPLNPTSVIIIEKKNSEHSIEQGKFQCPNTKTRLVNCGEVFYAPDTYLMYPVISGIPCLLESQAILGSKYNEDIHL